MPSNAIVTIARAIVSWLSEPPRVPLDHRVRHAEDEAPDEAWFEVGAQSTVALGLPDDRGDVPVERAPPFERVALAVRRAVNAEQDGELR